MHIRTYKPEWSKGIRATVSQTEKLIIMMTFDLSPLITKLQALGFRKSHL